MKALIICSFLMYSFTGFAQDQLLKKGNTVYVESAKSDVGKSAGAEFRSALQNWGYWQVTESKKNADFIIQLDTKISGGVTWTSWGGKGVALSAAMKSPSDETIWESEYYKSSPNGANGFNSQSAAVKKLMKGLKRKFNG